MGPKSCFLRNLFVGFVVVCGIWTRMPWMMVSATGNKTMTTVNVGVVLDLSSRVGKMSLSCIDMSVSDFYVSHPQHNTTIVLHIRDSKGDVLGAVAQGMELIEKSKVEAILGMEIWWEAYFIMKQLGEKAEVPIISLAPKTSTLSYLKSPYLFRIAHNQSSQVYAITAILTSFGWKQVVAMYQDDGSGNWIIADLIQASQDVNIHVLRSVIEADASGDMIGEELQKVKTTMWMTVVVVHMEQSVATQVLKKAEEIGMMSEGYAWIVSSATANVLNTLNYSTLSSMQGVLGVKAHVPRTAELQNFTTRWRRKVQQQNPNPTMDEPQLDVYGVWAYDAALALAIAVQRIKTDPNFTAQNHQNGKRIMESLSKTKFKGLSGEFNLVKGQLESPNLEIVNVIGDGQIMRVGYWTPEFGLTGELNRKGNLRPIIWPGDSVTPPSGWNIQKILRIGVPVNSFMPLVLNNGSFSGYCIDIFEAVVAELPYTLSYNYLSVFDTHRHRPESENSSYDDLIVQVSLGYYDAAVGDITILANRSSLVDFTLPFAEPGIAVVVPLRRDSRNHAWVFLKPLTLDLWITSFCFFIFIGFVVWILEHQNNEELGRGSPSHQIGTTLWFSFSTMVFAQRETLVSNLARFVVVIWFFVVFILTQSYTASLTSWLTVQQLRPVTDINQIIKNDWYVGYQRGSFVFDTLKFVGIKNLVAYDSLEELHGLFTKGRCNGGIDAAIDEIPYMKLLLSTYPDNYTMGDSQYNSGGFGFAFPIGSPLVDDMSTAVLRATQSDKISKIQDKWFKKKISHQSCTANSELAASSSSLDLSYFWTLFLISASAAILALFLYFFPTISPDCSTMWARFAATATFHIFRFEYGRQRRVAAEGASPTTTAPPSPSSDSGHGNQASLEIIHHP